jgi:hypothetical protein
VELVPPELTLADKRLGCGCILVFQRQLERYQPPEDDAAANYYAVREDELPGTYDFFVSTRTRMVLAQLFLGFDADQELVAVRYPTHLKLGELKSFIGQLVGVPWDPAQNAMLLFFGTNAYLHSPGFNNDHPQPLQPAPGGQLPCIILQCPNGITEVAANDWRVLLVHVVTDGAKVATAAVCYPPETPVATVLRDMEVNGDILLAESYAGNIGKSLTPQTLLKDFHQDLRADVVPAAWRAGGVRLIPVHIAGEEREFGKSFWLDLRPGKPLRETRARICATLPEADPRAGFEVEFREPSDQRLAETVALWDIHDAVRRIHSTGGTSATAADAESSSATKRAKGPGACVEVNPLFKPPQN